MLRTLLIVLLLAVSVTAFRSVTSEHPIISLRDSFRLLDEFGDVQCEDYLARMDSAIIEAQNNPSNKVFVIVYEGKLTQRRYDRKGKSTTYFVNPPVGTAKARIRSMKRYLELRGDPKNFVFIEGGSRGEFLVRLYLIPSGVKLPEPFPTQKKIKFGKGKPKGFCPGCCGP